MMSRFTYKSLNTLQSEVRLISLQPSETHSPIECQLLSANLDDEPAFEALSYEWGPSNSSNAGTWIKLNGQECLVRSNLRLALDHLRLQDKPRIFWIDALCINQEDVKERNHQVAQMGKIYAQASRVVAWLGLRDLPVTTAVQLLQDLEPTKQMKQTMVQPSFVHQKSLLELCSRSYWERLWIIQELVLAKAVCVQCGDLTFDLNLFGNIDRSLLQALDYRQRLRILNSLPLKIVKLRQERQDRGQNEEGEGSESDSDSDSGCGLVRPRTGEREDMSLFDERATSLLDVMYEASLSKCMDRRDKVFGLLSLVHRCCRKAIRPDYSMSLENICQNILNHHLSQHFDTKHKPTGSGSPVHIVRKLLESFGLNLTKNLRDPHKLVPEPISCERAMNSDLCPMSNTLYRVPSISQKIAWVSSTPRIDPETGTLLMNTPLMHEAHFVALIQVFEGAKNGLVKPRFVPGEALEGHELYFKPPHLDFMTLFESSSKVCSYATIPLDSRFDARGTSSGRQESAAKLSTLDANCNPMDEVYLRRYPSPKEPEEKGRSSLASKGPDKFDDEKWGNFLRWRGKTMAMQQLKMFVTDQGQVGYATQNCKSGDLVCEISDGNQKVAIFDRSYKLFELSRHGLIGKGILLRQSSELAIAGREKKIELLNKGLNDRLRVNFTETNCTIHLDFASLLYVSGYY